jgi:hypothetical protein
MNRKSAFRIIAAGILLSLLSLSAFAQKNEPTALLLKRTKYQTETVELGMGGTFSVIGAPVGSIEIEGWNKNEIEITSEIEVQAYTEEDLKLLAEVTGFALDEGLTEVSLVSVGTHDKKYLKKNHKNFPKNLRELPFRIDYKIKVPHFTDLEVNGGRGDFRLSLVEGMMRINYLESNARLSLVGGAVQATIGQGDVDVTIATRSWRGQFAEVQVAKGSMNLWLPKNLNANLTAKVINSGKIDNTYEMLKPLKRTKFSETEMYAKAGNGGAELLFSVGDGNLKIADFETVAER